MTKVAVLHHAPDQVGESPLWDAERGCLWWVDIVGRAVRRADLSTGEARSFGMEMPPGALALGEGHEVVVAAGTGWHLLDPEAGTIREFARPDAPEDGWRMNDGCVDPAGRFWAGSVDEPKGSGAGGRLWRLDADGPRQVLDGLGTQNGTAFSPDGRTFYLADSHPDAAVIWAFDFDVASGAIGNRRIFHRPERGRPDGAAIDSDGCYWFAAIDAGRIVQVDPEGRQRRAIDLPVSRPTKPAFGGPDLATLCITTMSVGTAGEALAGAVLTLEAGVRGQALPHVKVN